MIEPTDQNTTPWFPVSVNPVHVGVYQVVNRFTPNRLARYSFWNGQVWGICCTTPDSAFHCRETQSCDMYSGEFGRNEAQWRGLREQQK